jgi:hypothetical protein
VGDIESSASGREPHDEGAQLLEDVEAMLAELKGSAVSDRDTQTVAEMERLTMAVTNDRKELRAELDEGSTAITPEPSFTSMI